MESEINMNQQLKLYNGIVITPDQLLHGASVLITGNCITEISEGNIDAPNALSIDVQGNYISPGFIDLHVHGGGGADFMDGSEAAFFKVAETHAQYGTTALVPTTLTSDKESLLKTLDIYRPLAKNTHHGAQFLGMHLEGPYFALNQRGAQDPKYIRDPDPKEYEEIVAYSSDIARWSAAPELKGAIPFAKYLLSKGILPALAHTDAIYEEVLEGFENGYKLATHLYSGMSGVTRRNCFRFAGVIESAFLIDDMDVEIIADGIHLPAPLLKLVYKIKGPDRIALITDAMRGAGMPEGDSVLGNYETGLKVIIEDGVAKLPDRSSFAGSVATCDRLVRNMIKMADVPLLDAVKMMTQTPARIMGVDQRKGSLLVGKDADLTLFDTDINVLLTIVNGKIVYNQLT